MIPAERRALSGTPNGWEWRRLKFLFRQQQRPPVQGEEIVTAFRDGTVTRRSNRRMDGFTFADKEIGYQAVCRGDLVISAMDAFAGAVGVSDSNGKCSPVYSVCTPLPGNKSEYYAAVLRHLAISGFIASLAKGIRERSTDFRWSEARDLVLPVPPFVDQCGIAEFLDRKTTAIDDLIQKKERLIELLQEKRQALITQAVTKGLDPNVPMKDSGIDCFSQVPRHWKVLRVKHLVSLVTSGSRGWSEYFAEEGVAFLQSGNLDRRMGLDLSALQRVVLPRRVEGKRTAVRTNDVLVCITGALTGNVGLVREPLGEGYVNQHLALVRPREDCVVAPFLAYVLHGSPGQRQFWTSQYGLKQGLGLEDVANVWVPIPPVSEQTKIVEILDCETRRYEQTAVKLEDSAAKLREYRQALITAAVTGQLDIPAEAA
jgi:type I restriction enzyme, S subunit